MDKAPGRSGLGGRLTSIFFRHVTTRVRRVKIYNRGSLSPRKENILKHGKSSQKTIHFRRSMGVSATTLVKTLAIAGRSTLP